MAVSEKLLIVNADDLGYTPGTTAGVLAAHRRGLVTSTTLMVGLPAAAAAAVELDGFSDLGVGLHVTLTRGVPTLPPAQLPSLVDAAGRFPLRPEDLDGADPDQLLTEVRSQLARFRGLTGRLPTHLDTHHHAHRRPVVLDALVTVARENGLPVRNAAPQVGERLRRAGVATTDAFIESFFGADARLEVLLEILAAVRPGTTELMCHPGRADEELRAVSSYSQERERELEILTHPEALRAVEAHGIRLVHFGTLCGS